MSEEKPLLERLNDAGNFIHTKEVVTKFQLIRAMRELKEKMEELEEKECTGKFGLQSDVQRGFQSALWEVEEIIDEVLGEVELKK